MTSNLRQRDLFDHVADAYAASPTGRLDNRQLYSAVAGMAGIGQELITKKVPIGRSGQEHSPLARQVRWRQQDLKRLGLIERVDGERGLWQLTDAGEQKLRRAAPGVALLAFSTDLGLAIWGSCGSVFKNLGLPITLCITSPPYPLAKPRAYGNPPVHQYVDFIVQALEPIVANLAPGGSIAINLSNDIYEPGMGPARSTTNERLVIALEDRLGLSLVDRLVWYNPSRPPGPVRWASMDRVLLNQSYEPVLWMTNDPHRLCSDNRRVLAEHSERHLRLMAGGGEQRITSYGDGAHGVRKGSYGKRTEGKIPRNVLTFGHSCRDTREYRRDAQALGLQPHGATMPLSLAKFLIQFLTAPGELVVDPFAGTLKSAKAAEELGRPWIVTEWMLAYIRASAERFRGAAGFRLHPAL